MKFVNLQRYFTFASENKIAIEQIHCFSDEKFSLKRKSLVWVMKFYIKDTVLVQCEICFSSVSEKFF